MSESLSRRSVLAGTVTAAVASALPAASQAIHGSNAAAIGHHGADGSHFSLTIKT